MLAVWGGGGVQHVCVYLMRALARVCHVGGRSAFMWKELDSIIFYGLILSDLNKYAPFCLFCLLIRAYYGRGWGWGEVFFVC